MSSQINPNNIDTTFPIAGQDNDTQGFRTNYINIKNNFVLAAAEITSLQANAAVAPKITAAPYSTSAAGTAGQIAYGTINSVINVVSTSTIGNLITVSTTNNLTTGMPFVIAGGNIGGLMSGTTYYITSIADSNHITVGNTVNLGTQFPVSNSSVAGITGTISNTYLYVCVATNSWLRTRLTGWIAA